MILIVTCKITLSTCANKQHVDPLYIRTVKDRPFSVTFCTNKCLETNLEREIQEGMNVNEYHLGAQCYWMQVVFCFSPPR